MHLKNRCSASEKPKQCIWKTAEKLKHHVMTYTYIYVCLCVDIYLYFCFQILWYLIFRSSFDALFTHLKDLKESIKKKHIMKSCQKHPINNLFKDCYLDLNKDNNLFNNLFKPNQNDNLDLNKDNKVIENILHMYDNGQKGFIIGSQCLCITVDDICVAQGYF